MFKKIPTPNPDILAFEVIGNISKEDYVDTLIPIIHKYKGKCCNK